MFFHIDMDFIFFIFDIVVGELLNSISQTRAKQKKRKQATGLPFFHCFARVRARNKISYSSTAYGVPLRFPRLKIVALRFVFLARLL